MNPFATRGGQASAPGPSLTSSLLLHFNGSGPYDFVDSSPNNVAINDNGTNMFSPGSGKFGSRGLNNGNVAALKLTAGDAWSNLDGAFTFDCWHNGGNAGNGLLLLSADNPDFGSMTAFGIISSTYGSRICAWNSSGGGYSAVVGLGTSNLLSAADKHLAWTRDDAGILRMFVGGHMEKEMLYTAPINFGRFSSNVFMGGGSAANSSTFSSGIISEARLIKGVAAFTADFTPPTAPYAA